MAAPVRVPPVRVPPVRVPAVRLRAVGAGAVGIAVPPAVGTAVHTAATLGAGALLRLLRPRLDGAWFRVRPGERRWHRRAGVDGFRRALRAGGWERVVTRVRGFDGTRAGLVELDRHTRLSEASHLLGAAAALAVLGTRGPDLVLAALLHAHPVLLQRSLRARIAALYPP